MAKPTLGELKQKLQFLMDAIEKRGLDPNKSEFKCQVILDDGQKMKTLDADLFVMTANTLGTQVQITLDVFSDEEKKNKTIKETRIVSNIRRLFGPDGEVHPTE